MICILQFDWMCLKSFLNLTNTLIYGWQAFRHKYKFIRRHIHTGQWHQNAFLFWFSNYAMFTNNNHRKVSGCQRGPQNHIDFQICTEMSFCFIQRSSLSHRSPHDFSEISSGAEWPRLGHRDNFVITGRFYEVTDIHQNLTQLPDKTLRSQMS